MSSCSIKWCGKNSKNSNYTRDGITFHRFPKIPKIKDAWITATKRENWFPATYNVICSRHFTADCFEQLKGNRRRLYPSAVPTLLLPHLANEDEASSHEVASTSIIRKDLIQSDHIKEESNENVSQSSTAEKALCRKITELSMRLRKSQLAVKRIQDKNRHLKNKVNSMLSLLEKLKSKGSITQENIDIERLQTSNRQLRKKVVMLRRLLSEQKKRNMCAERNMVWCPLAESAETDMK